MLPRDFVSRVVPDDGFYILATINSNGTFRQSKLSTLDLISSNVQAMVNKRQDVYFAVSSFSDLSKGRVRGNIKSKKALYLDLDVGDDKPFATQSDAARALYVFLEATQMPKPSIITSSGYGIHVYWTFPTPIGADQWHVLAMGLGALCAANGFEVDTACTEDSSRVLRVPGTMNYKHPNTPRACAVISEADDVDFALLEQALAMEPLSSSKPQLTLLQGGLPGGDNADLSQGAGYTPPAPEDVFANCPTLQHALDTGGATSSESLWQLHLHVLAHLPEGRAYAHKVSCGYPGYSEKETDAKFNAKLACIDAGSTTGPASCASFSTTAGNKCDTCPLFGEVKNPLLAARMRKPNELPLGFQDSSKGTSVYSGDQDGVALWRVITPTRFYNASVQCPAGDTAEEFACYARTGPGKPTMVNIPLIAMADTASIMRRLAGYNILISQVDQLHIGRMLVSWIEQMKKARDVVDVPGNLGWTHTDGAHGFALPEHVLWPGGVKSPSTVHVDAVIGRAYTAQGTLPQWQRAATLITENENIELQVALASAFAAPLMKLTNTAGAVLAIVSEASGIGKTKALQTAQAVWGAYDSINHTNDTENAIVKKLGLLNNLPAYWDELSFASHDKDTAKFLDTLFRLAQGKEKARLDRGAKMQDSGSWSTLMVVASNDSLDEHITLSRPGNSAGTMRLLELDIKTPTTTNKYSASFASSAFAALEHNHGIAGLIFAQHLVDNYDAVLAQLNKRIDAVSTLECMRGTGQTQRMRVATVACLLVGAVIANNLGLCRFNVTGMAVRLINAISPTGPLNDPMSEGRGHAPMTAKDLVYAYMDEFADYINKVDIFPKSGSGVTIVTAQPNRLPVRCMVSATADRVRIGRGHFSTWVTKNYGSGRRTIKYLKSLPTTRVLISTLDSGLRSHVSGKKIALIELDI